MSTIISTITSSITLGAGNYPSPLTITPVAYVNYNGPNYAITGTGTLVNQGSVAQLGSLDGAISLTGASSVTNSGSITDISGYGIRLGGTGGISNAATGVISGRAGVYLYGAGSTLTNLGTISTSHDRAVYLKNGGAVTNGQAGTGASTATLLGGDGVYVDSLPATVTNYGSIIGQNGSGIWLSDGGTVVNGGTSALIQGYSSGIVSTGTYNVQISNYGSIVGEDDDAISLQGSGTVANLGTASLIQGYSGVFTNGTANVTNAGTILGIGYDGYAVLGESGGAVTNGNAGAGGATALLQGGGGVFFSAAGTVTNYGSIIGQNYTGIWLNNGGTVVNGGPTATSAMIQGQYYGINSQGTAGIQVSNYGSIVAEYDDAISVHGSGTVANLGSASLIEGSTGIFIGGTASVTNAGTIETTEQHQHAISAGGGTVTNGYAGAGGSTALIEGPNGVEFNSAAGTVTNFGNINGQRGLGIRFDDGGTVVNGGPSATSALIQGYYGGIASSGTAGVQVTNYGSISGIGDAISVAGSGTVANLGTASLIQSYYNAAYFNGTASVTNAGTIKGTWQYGYAIDGRNGGAVTNGDTGAGGAAALVQGVGGGIYFNNAAATVTNYGRIVGQLYDGIRLAGGGTIIDSGLIYGGGTAVAFGGSGSNLLVLEQGYTLSGAVYGSASATNTLELLGSTAAPVTAIYNSLGLENFGTVAFAPGYTNDATLKITNDAALPGTIANFIGVYDTIDLTALNYATNSTTAVLNTASNTLTITAGTSSVYLQLGAGNYAGINWVTQNDGSGGTDLHVAPNTISSSTPNATLTGGGGSNVFIATGSNEVVGVTGLATVSASGTDDTVYADSNPLTLTDSGTGDAIGLYTGQANLTLSGSNASVYANSGNVTLVDNGTDDAIGAYTGTLAATLSGSGTRIYGGSGPMTVDVANTATGIAIGTGVGPASITAAGSNTTIFGGSGSLSADVTGSNVAVGLDDGPAALTLSGSAARVYGGSGSLTVDDQGSADTIGAGSGATTINAAGTNLVVAGGGGSLLFVGGAGNATVYAGTGATSVQGGAGATTLYGGAGGSIADLSGSGPVVYQAGAGSGTFNGGGASGPMVINGGIDPSGYDLLVGGSGNDSLFAGTGADTLTGGAGSNEFVFYKTVINGAAPTDVVTDFSANDTVYLAGYGSSAASSDIASAVSSGGNTMLTLSDNTKITFLGVSSASALTGHIVSF